MFSISDIDRIMETDCNLRHFTGNCGTKNLNDFEGDNGNTYLWRAGLLNVKEKRRTSGTFWTDI